MENGPHEEASFAEEEELEDDIPPAVSPSEELEDEEEEEQPLRKRPRRRSCDSASASSPVKDADVEGGEDGDSSSGTRHLEDMGDPLAAPPISSALPTEFARMPSISLGSEDDVDGARLVVQPSPCLQSSLTSCSSPI